MRIELWDREGVPLLVVEMSYAPREFRRVLPMRMSLVDGSADAPVEGPPPPIVYEPYGADPVTGTAIYRERP